MRKPNRPIYRASAKPVISFVSNGVTPYGIRFLERISDEISEFHLRTIYSYPTSMGGWNIQLPDSIHAVYISQGISASAPPGIANLISEWMRFRGIVREIRASNPSVVAILGYGSLTHILTIEWCRKSRIPVLLLGDSNIRGDVHFPLFRWLKMAIVSRIVSRCDAILPCGSLGVQYFLRYGARPEQIFVSPVECNYSLFDKTTAAEVEATAALFNFDLARRRIIFSGRLVAIKRVDLLIDAFIQISEERHQWDLVIVGDGPLNADLASRLPDRLMHRVHWVGFIGTPERMAPLYRLSDVLVVPSKREAWALVINEAACAGLAIVCSDVVGACPELVQDGVNGRIFRSGDLTSLVDALLNATDESNLERYKAASTEILRSWREKADPVEGFRRAVSYVLGLDL